MRKWKPLNKACKMCLCIHIYIKENIIMMRWLTKLNKYKNKWVENNKKKIEINNLMRIIRTLRANHGFFKQQHVYQHNNFIKFLVIFSTMNVCNIFCNL